jgi:glycosyltransferase involved in cell wall biosynthesis
MRIAFEDGFAIDKGGGIGQHTLNLFNAMKVLCGDGDVKLVDKPILSKISYAPLGRILYLMWLNGTLQFLLDREHIDVAHFTNFLVPNIRLSKAKYAVTIHDLTAWKYPETLPSLYLPYIKKAISHAVIFADLIFTVSETIKKEIIELFKISGEKIYVGYSGISDRFLKSSVNSAYAEKVKSKFSIKKEFLLFVGAIEERKNIITLVKAVEELKKYLNLQLVLAGKPGYGYSIVEKYLQEHRLQQDVIVTGYISEEEKIALYDSSKVFIFPSLYEGFGTPLLEAMARGVPVIASKIPTTEEIAGDNVIYYGNPLDYNLLADNVMKLLVDENLYQKLSAKGRTRAKQFSWEQVAKEHLKAYQNLLHNN